MENKLVMLLCGVGAIVVGGWLLRVVWWGLNVFGGVLMLLGIIAVVYYAAKAIFGRN